MPRNKIKMKDIDGMTYYTTTYFAEQVGVGSRQARKYLEDFQSLEGHTNPRLFDKKTIEKAVNAYMSGRQGELFAEQRRNKMREIEQKRAEEEFMTFYASIDEATQKQSNSQESDEGAYIEEHINTYVNTIYKSELGTMLLKHILFNQGFVFDEGQFKKDLLTIHFADSIRQVGDEYSDKELDALYRLNSNNAYLIDK